MDGPGEQQVHDADTAVDDAVSVTMREGSGAVVQVVTDGDAFEIGPRSTAGSAAPLQPPAPGTPAIRRTASGGVRRRRSCAPAWEDYLDTMQDQPECATSVGGRMRHDVEGG
jgi:hypothetical protein